MSNQINQIAHRMARWARSGPFPVEKTCGYCMSGSWDNFYQQLLFPNKVLRDDVLRALVQKLKQLGFGASLAIKPFENGKGLYMYMQMRVIKLMKLIAAELPSTSAEAIRAAFRSDTTLPNKADFDKMAADPSLIPSELRTFDLVFPNTVLNGLSEGGGADKVTDDSIGMLVWNGAKWEPKWLLAGKDGWGRSGPDHCSTHARLARYAA